MLTQIGRDIKAASKLKLENYGIYDDELCYGDKILLYWPTIRKYIENYIS